MTGSEARVAARKVLRCRAKVMAQGKPTMPARTVDISTSGISLMLEQSMGAGEACVIAFEAPVNGAMRRVMVSAKAVYSVCGADGFRIGFQFVQLDAANTAIINELAR